MYAFRALATAAAGAGDSFTLLKDPSGFLPCPIMINSTLDLSHQGYEKISFLSGLVNLIFRGFRTDPRWPFFFSEDLLAELDAGMAALITTKAPLPASLSPEQVAEDKRFFLASSPYR